MSIPNHTSRDTHASSVSLRQSQPPLQLSSKAVRRIKVKQLFGAFDYDLPGPDPASHFSDIAILYGDNGSGKTTLLKTVFHLLAQGSGKGHRSGLLKIPFRLFSITLNDGTSIIAERTAKDLIGAYSIKVMRDDHELSAVTFDPDVNRRMFPHEQRETYLTILSALHLDISFLSAEREMATTSPEYDEPDSREADLRAWIAQRALESLPRVRQEQKDAVLHHAVERAREWIARQAVIGTNVGTGSAHAIYTEIVNRIAHFGRESDAESATDRVVGELRQVSERNKAFSRFHFTSPLMVDELVDTLLRAPESQRGIITSILEPYINSLRARLDALDDIQSITAKLVDNLNGFYVGKHVDFSLSKGLQFFNDKDTPLDPSVLSSGERQLLLMFCNTLVSRDKPSIFIIDEPELSLNIKWQRKLITALRDIVTGSEMQFIFATHSIEFLAQHRDKVVRLKDGAA